MNAMHRFLTALLALVLLAGAAAPLAAEGEPPDVNLALGKSYTVDMPYPDPLWLTNQKSWADTGNRELTDGVFGSPTFTSPYTGYLRADRRIVTVDLGAEVTVRKVLASFFQNKSWGVYFPESVTFSLSGNGTAWTRLGTVPTNTDRSAIGNFTQRYELDGFSYLARYLKVEIPTGVYVFIDEIQALGQPMVAADAVKPQPTPAQPQPQKGFPRPSSATGMASQQVLIFGGYYAYDNRIPTWTESDFKPYVTYVDTAGASRDFMYDSFLFIPIAKAQSGRDYGPAAGPSNMVDWLAYINQTFDPVNQLAALDKAAATARAELNNNSYRAKVVITIPFPSPLQGNFGDVNGDGISENLNHDLVGSQAAAANRIAVVQWYVDQVLARWQAGNYQYLDLVGFYWYSESVRYAMSPVEETVMTGSIGYIHDKGYKVNWIPMVHGEGFQKWENLGFDQVNMQPNYAFQAATVQRLPQVAELARQYGMGVEMELDDRILAATPAGAALRTKFVEYMDHGWKEGYMHAFTNWYQQVKTLLKASQSTNPDVRRMYDLSYLWIKGTYKPSDHPGDGNGINNADLGMPDEPGRADQQPTEAPPVQ